MPCHRNSFGVNFTRTTGCIFPNLCPKPHISGVSDHKPAAEGKRSNTNLNWFGRTQRAAIGVFILFKVSKSLS